MGLNWGQIKLNIIGGSHIIIPVKKYNKIEHDNQIFFWIPILIVFISEIDLNTKMKSMGKKKFTWSATLFPTNF